MIIYAQANGKANLVCDIQAPSADDSVALILWYKDDSLAPIYTVDARKGKLGCLLLVLLLLLSYLWSVGMSGCLVVCGAIAARTATDGKLVVLALEAALVAPPLPLLTLNYIYHCHCRRQFALMS